MTTIVTIRDVVHMQTGREKALRWFALDHKPLHEKFRKFCLFANYDIGIDGGYFYFDKVVDEFIKTLNIRILEEHPVLVKRGDCYRIDVDYLIEFTEDK